MLRQRLLLEEYGCEIKYIEGARNVVADPQSRLEAESGPEMTCESHFTIYIYQDNAFLIPKVYGNGTIKIDRGGYSEVIHIHRLKP